MGDQQTLAELAHVVNLDSLARGTLLRLHTGQMEDTDSSQFVAMAQAVARQLAVPLELKRGDFPRGFWGHEAFSHRGIPAGSLSHWGSFDPETGAGASAAGSGGEKEVRFTTSDPAFQIAGAQPELVEDREEEENIANRRRWFPSVVGEPAPMPGWGQGAPRLLTTKSSLLDAWDRINETILFRNAQFATAFSAELALVAAGHDENGTAPVLDRSVWNDARLQVDRIRLLAWLRALADWPRSPAALVPRGDDPNALVIGLRNALERRAGTVTLETIVLDRFVAPVFHVAAATVVHVGETGYSGGEIALLVGVLLYLGAFHWIVQANFGTPRGKAKQR